MKVCEYCDCEIPNNESVCPHCNGNSFDKVCPDCGHHYDGRTCPKCKRSKEIDQLIDQEVHSQQQAKSGMAWKVILTVFIPFVGGYFTITPEAPKGVRIFGIVWCGLCALYALSLIGTDTGLLSSLIAFIVFILPIFVYATKVKKRKK